MHTVKSTDSHRRKVFDFNGYDSKIFEKTNSNKSSRLNPNRGKYQFNKDPIPEEHKLSPYEAIREQGSNK